MVRTAFHGPVKKPPKTSILTSLYRLIYRPKPVIVYAAHYPKYSLHETTSSGSRAIAMHRAHPASKARNSKTDHYSTRPRIELERLVMIIGATIVGSSVAYWAASRDEVVFTRRRRTMAFSWDFERKLFSNKNEKGSQRKDDPKLGRVLSPDENDKARMVHEITNRILAVMKEEFPETYEQLDWNVNVRENPRVNAFYQPGGMLTVFSGLIDMVVKAEIDGQVGSARDALALVIAHEISHGMARHGMEKLSWLPIQIPFLVLTPDLDVMYETFNFGLKLPHSRKLENEADIIGVHLMAAAGFDPREAPRMFRVLNKSPKLLEWTSTHPVGETRAGEAENILAKEMPTFEKNRGKLNDGYVWPDLRKEVLASLAMKAPAT